MGSATTVLCIDDDLDDLMFIREAILSFNPVLEIIEVPDGKAGLDYLSDCKMNEMLPCLIIMDINMPRMDGKKTMNLIRKDDMLSAIPLVVFTTSSNAEDRKYFEDLGVTYFTKPSHYNSFLKKVKEIVMEFSRKT